MYILMYVYPQGLEGRFWPPDRIAEARVGVFFLTKTGRATDRKP